MHRITNIIMSTTVCFFDFDGNDNNKLIYVDIHICIAYNNNNADCYVKIFTGLAQHGKLHRPKNEIEIIK